ncbi:MAG: methyltransferase domain-containing protein [Cyanobacteriota bacterium]|nr:methyltransferase domain-containing protein [Cyanobacteriota bacterium]
MRLRDRWPLNNESNRHRAVRQWLAALPPGSSLLDAGAGVQRYRPDAAHLQYTSQDFGEYKGGDVFGDRTSPLWDASRCDLLCDITAIPRPDHSFDAVLCTEVFEHLPDPQLALKELARVLKPGGQLMLTAPFRALYHQEPYFFTSGFSRYWYEHHAHSCGLEIAAIEPNGSYLADVAQELVRIARLGPLWQSLCASLLALPLVAYLGLLQRWGHVKTPESCWGYHVWLVKPA